MKEAWRVFHDVPGPRAAFFRLQAIGRGLLTGPMAPSSEGPRRASR
jgi:hypothetical protein